MDRGYSNISWVSDINIHLMGEAQSICCQDTADHKNIIGIVNEPTWGDYYEAQWPDNEEIKHFLAGSEGSGKYTDKVRKHRSQEKYYQGDWENEQPKGQGVIYALDKFYYEGTLIAISGGFDGTPHGSGKLELIKEGVVYQGQINHGKADGEGKIHSKDDRYCFEGQW